ncbi:MBG domain-containing protein [Flavobacterium sp. N1736]|uniref:MBG domain-containing protein n=1 Tax=Flavobacterium sp. N1736 TaxID=2986823 RepID=UPI002224D9A1|nr:MBG domain-containing protein [Flavobacterium sp. N1736]
MTSDSAATINLATASSTVTPAVLTITSDNKSKVYAAANPTLTIFYTGFVNGDTVASLTTAPTISTTADAASPVGSYPITASGAVNANYDISYVDGILTVNPVNLAIAADNQTKVYGSANPTLTVTYTGFVNGDTEADLITLPITTTTADTASSVGVYPITVSGATSNNYTIGYTSGATLTVTKANLTITADNQSKVYGDANPTLTASYSGFVNGDTSVSLTTPATASTLADTTSPVGTYAITASGATSSNYTFTYVDGTLTVTTAVLTITADNQTKVYGSVNPALTASYTGFVNGDTIASLTTPAIASTVADTASAVGTYAIIASGAVSPNYTFTYVDGALTVTTAVLTITADAQTKIYGSVNPALTASYSGFVNGDTVASLTTPATASTIADTSSPVGTYAITSSGAVSPNYTFTFVDGTLTVTTAVLTITADAQTKVYGSVNPALTASYSGFVNGDTVASLTTPATASTIADTSSPVGTYAITANGAVSPNYTFTYVDGTLTVTTAVLTITADAQTKVYGSANPTLTASYTGFVNGDTVTSLTTPAIASTVADTTSPVGTYAITASGAVSPNYTFTYVDGTLTVTTAVLTITADNKSKVYGDVNPVLTASFTGFVNGDTELNLTTPPVLNTTAVTGSPVGTYPITVSGAVSSNYNINYVDGSLTVGGSTILTITVENKSKIYGEANPALTVTYSGFVNGDTSANLLTQPTISTIADTASAVGTYAITASGAASDNYTIVYVDGTLTVNTAVLTITADAQTKVYGSANPTLTASYSGFVNGDTVTSLTTPATASTIADTTSPVGTYAITANGAVSPNYTFTYVDGALTVTTAVLTITADAQTKVYGSANPALTASYSGFVNGDTVASLTTPATASTIADTTSPVGTYAITANGAVSPNYTFTYVDGTLTVTTAVLTVTADAQTKVYGTANPALTASYSGFVNGDTVTSLTTPAIASTVADASSPVGTYAITASGAVSPNYTFTYVDGTLTVTTAVLTITADAQTKVYGSANPTLTASYSGFVNGDTVTSLTTPAIASTIADVTSAVGTYPITASGATSSNYTFTYVDGTLTVTTAVLTITADAQTKVYGTINPALTASYSGFVNSDTVTSLTTPAIASTIADASSPVGTYPITASGATSSNYTFTYVDGTLTVTTAVLTITADTQTKVYGSANPTLTASYTGFVNGDTVTSLTTPAIASTIADATSPVGTYAITASGATSSNYTFTYVDGTLTVTTAVLTITADAQTKVYGSSNPSLTASYSGFVNGDTVASLTTPAIASSVADTTSPVGTYAITANGAVSPNYTFTYVDGTLTVTTAVLIITADVQTKVYGSANPTLTTSYSGFVNGDTVTNLTTPATIATLADISSPVGTYAITASGATSSNYTFTYVDGTLTVTTAVLTITADAQTKVYGAINPTLTASYTGFVNGDTSTSLTTLPTIVTLADTSSPVGTYAITASGAVSPNYTISYTDGILTITTATLTITADNKGKVYGDVNPVLTASYIGFVNGDTELNLTTPPILNTTAVTSSPVGTYPITASGAVSSNYSINYVDGSLTVGGSTILTITVENKSKIYGEANPGLTVTYSGFVNGDTSADLLTQPIISTVANTASAVGTYAITASGATSDNYTIIYVDGTLTVNTASLVVTSENKTKVYGEANPVLTVTYSGFVNGDASTSLTTAATANTIANTASVVGTYAITANGATSSNYAISYVDGTLTVTTAVLTITADAQTKVYGSANPTLTASYSGFVNGDTSTSLTTLPTIATLADILSPVGTYAITASGAVSPNYTFVYVDGTLTVTTAVLTITADAQTKVYGAANPTLTASYSGFVNGDTSASLTTLPTIATLADILSPVGTYAITANGAVSPNYTFVYVDGTLTVTTAVLTITADAQTKVYGTINPTLTVSYSGFVNGDTSVSLTTQPTITTLADTSSPVGTYAITANGAVSPNYTFVYVDGTLTVTTAVLTVTADAQTKVYGSANPTLTASYSGFVNGDTSAGLTTLPTITTLADVLSPVGTYAITANGAVSSNYTFTYVDGTLTVTTASLTITADNKNKVYGDINPVLTATYTGFLNGDTEANLTTPAILSTTAVTGSPVGDYPITVSGATASNYSINEVAGTLSVTSSTLLTITVENKAKIYGEVNPTLTVTYTGFVNGDTSADLLTQPTISTVANTASAVGSYPIIASGATSDNYTIVYVDGTLAVNTANLVVTSENKTKIYGEANPLLTVMYSGFVNGDTSTSLTTEATANTIADTASPAGIYAITASGATSNNYAISYVDGALAIAKAELTITADTQTKIYGETNPALTASYTGFVNGDTSASLTTLPTIATIANTSSPVGTYAITVNGAVSDNYTFVYVDGTLTVSTATLTITADAQTKVYGTINPILTASYSGFVNGDTSTSLTTAPTISTIANVNSAVGTYPITVSGAASDNYTINYVDALLTVTTGTLTITADAQTKVYGEVNPNLTVSFTGFVNGDTSASLTTQPIVTTQADVNSPVGTYLITASGAVTDNYTVVYVDGSLAVTAATLTITANNDTKAYGTINPALTATYTGFVNGDTETGLTTLPVISTTATINSAVGIYPITASGATSDNYTINYVDGALTITTATLIITANDATKVYGEANPNLTVSYSGFLNGDTAASLTTQPTISTIADTSSPVGIFPITASGALSPNYAISYVDGSLTITTATLTITADNETKIYGEVNPPLTLTYTGFVNGDTNANLSAQPSTTTIGVLNSAVGTYPITASGALSSNYVINYVDGTLTVTAATLTITADNQTKIYGTANPILTANYAGFVNGDTSASLTTQPVIITTGDINSAVGTYPITASGATSNNYTFVYVDGTLTVTTAALTITANDNTKVYGTVNPALTAAYSGFVNGDTNASLTTQPVISTIAGLGSAVGTYPIKANGAVSNNYTISYVDGNLTITEALLTITADNKTKIYGEANPLLTASYTGFVNGDTNANLSTQPTISTTANTASPVGSYPITVSGAVSSNYIISYVNGILAVTPSSDANLANLTISNDVLSPAFSPNVTSYTATVGSETNSVTITPTSENLSAAITVNGVVVPTGNPSNAIALVTGPNIIVTQVTAQDGVTIKTYTITVTRAVLNDATLVDLSISEGILNPAFDPAVTNYTATVESNIASVAVTSLLSDPSAVMTLNGIAVNDGESRELPLIAGDNIIKVEVTAEDGITKKTYTVIINRKVLPDKVAGTNILSPNGDGVNDYWEIKDINLYPNNSVTVYDRGGRIVYAKNNYNNTWDGSYTGSPLNDDTYYYLINLGDGLPKIKGFITIIRQ